MERKIDKRIMKKLTYVYYQAIDLIEMGMTQQGIMLLESLADEGYPDIEILLADKYFDGKLLPFNFSKAVEWLEKACIKGNERAQDILNNLYSTWNEMKKNKYKKIKYKTFETK